MAVLAPNPCLYRELCLRDPWVQQSNGGGCSLVPSKGGGLVTVSDKEKRKRGRWRGEVKVEAFWQDVSRPTSIEMEAISGIDDLDEILRQAKELSQPIVIDWMAAWCRKCIYMKPKLEKLAAEYHPRIKFYFVDVNNVSQALVKRGNVSKMPTIQIWKDGAWKAEVIGGHKAWLVLEEVREMIKNN